MDSYFQRLRRGLRSLHPTQKDGVGGGLGGLQGGGHPAPGSRDRPSPPLQFGNEEQQLAWAKRESEKAEQERLARLRQQEQEDLELAIALSKADMPA